MKDGNIFLLYIDNFDNVKSLLKGKQKRYLEKVTNKTSKYCKELSTLNIDDLDLIFYNPNKLTRTKLKYVIDNFLEKSEAVLYVVIKGQNAKLLAEILSNWDANENYKIIYQEALDSFGMDQFIKPRFLQKIVFILTDKNVEIKKGELHYHPNEYNKYFKSRKLFLNTACSSLRELVNDNKLSESLRGLKLYFDQNKSFDSRDEVIMLNARLSRIKKESDLNLMTYEQREMFINKIAYSILEIIRDKV